MRGAIPSLALALLLGGGCGDEGQDIRGPEGAILRHARVGEYTIRDVPLQVFFVPRTPFTKRPLLLLETPPDGAFQLQARFVLPGAETLAQAAGRVWEVEEDLRIQLPGKADPLELSQADLRLEILAPTRVRCTLEGNGITRQGKDLNLTLLVEGPVVLLDGRIRPGK